MVTIIEDPPDEKNGKFIPVGGKRPIAIKIFIILWRKIARLEINANKKFKPAIRINGYKIDQSKKIKKINLWQTKHLKIPILLQELKK